MEHGGNIYKAAEQYGIDLDAIVDYSDNVNPLGVPYSAKEGILNNIDALSHYPDPEYKQLRKAISEYTSVDFENIIVGNGATELISLFIKVLKPKKALVVMPAYSEYQRELEINGARVSHYVLKREKDYKGDVEELCAMVQGNDIVVICNPNNPTGTAFTADEMKRVAEASRIHGAYLMVDETYVEFTDDMSVYSSSGILNEYPNVFIIRGFSKYFGIPGLRVGYAMTSDKELLRFINDKKDPWSVNLLADIAARSVLKDKDYIRRSKDFMSSERRFMASELKKIDKLKVYDSVCNFFLCEILADIPAKEIARAAVKKGLLIRDASTFKYLGDKEFRVCIKLRKENQLLLDFLKGVL
ncbi:threonine-phosphate decarboxylase CobD [Caldanaerobius polysaccharolyticus]|uniref:threonine-phosphate decarboxylase CobD n=1 Tax=Caldanaerobius polysaccharolyticus TaxID=44256 RepID=UPI000A037BAD|nr:threonine-phosphate decarboxylase CobD [Caldanaerobius polysaccharolyticus]